MRPRVAKNQRGHLKKNNNNKMTPAKKPKKVFFPTLSSFKLELNLKSAGKKEMWSTAG